MASMRKEITVGLSVITVLMLVLGFMVYRRAAAMWRTPENGEIAAATPPVSNQPRIIMAEDGPPAEAGFESPDGEMPPARPHEGLQSSFLPRAVDPSSPDGQAYPEGPGSGEMPMTEPETAADAVPATIETSQNPRHGARQTSHEVPVDEQGNAAALEGPPADFEAAAPLPSEVGEMPAEAPPQGVDDPWLNSAQRDAAEGVPTAGAMAEPAESTFNPPISDPAAEPAAGFGQYEPRGGQGRQHAPGGHHELERVTVENGKYTVAPHDSYWTIAEKVYGNGAYFKALREYNRQHHPRAERLDVGDVLDAPTATLLAERYPDLCPRPRKVPAARQTLQPASTRHRAGERVYIVAEGDTLFDIARHELGKAARWTEVYDLNRDVLGEDFDYLRPGTELVLPREQRDADTVTRKDDPVYQR